MKEIEALPKKNIEGTSNKADSKPKNDEEMTSVDQGSKGPKNVKKIVIASVAGVLALGAIGTGVYFGVIRKNSSSDEPAVSTVEEVSPADLEQMRKIVDDPNFYPGITINGQSVAGMSKDEVLKKFASTDEVKLDIQFQVGDEKVPLKTGDLKFESNAEAVIEEAYNYGRTSTFAGDDAIVDRFHTIDELTRTPKDFTFETALKTEGVDIDKLVRDTLNPYNTELVEAQLGDFNLEKLEFEITESQKGCKVDIDQAITDVKAKLDAGEYQSVITVKADIVEPTTSSDDLKAQFGMISTTTSETTSNENRNTNIRLICEKLDGLVLQPGEQFNFNDYFGQRTAEKGYKEAHGIFNGSMRDELGGGICQANTMLYQSVTKADLQVDERKNHSIPSTYVDKGTDATVTWTSPNFRFTNSSEYPIAIHAVYADQKVTVAVYGRLLPDGQYIQLESEHVRTISPSTVYVADPTLAAGTKNTVTSGRTGYDYKSYKVWYDKDGNEIKREPYFSSHYPVRDEVIHVGTLGADGSIYQMDPSGNLGDPTTTPTPTPDPNNPPPADPNAPPANPTPTPTPVPADPNTPPADPTPTPEPPPADPTPTPEPPPADPTPTPTPEPEPPTPEPEPPTPEPEPDPGTPAP